MEDLSLGSQTQAYSSQPSCPTSLPSRKAPSQGAAPSAAFADHTASSAASASAHVPHNLSTFATWEKSVNEDHSVDVLSTSQVQAYSSRSSRPIGGVPSQDIAVAGVAPSVAEASAQGSRNISPQLSAHARSEKSASEDHPMDDVLLHYQTPVYPSRPLHPTDPPSGGAPLQDVAAAGVTFASRAAPSIAGTPALGTDIVTALSKKQVDRDHPMEEFSLCSPTPDQLPHLSDQQLRTSPLPELSSSPHPTRLDTRYLVFQNLTPGVTIDDIAKRLGAPAAEGGCGVWIVSGAPIPSSNLGAFVIEFASIHEARLAGAGWSSGNPGASVGPAPSPLLSTIEFKSYLRPSAELLLNQSSENPGQRSYCHEPSTLPQSSRTSSSLRSAPHRPSPYAHSSRPPPKRSLTRAALLATHHRYGYMARKGLLPD